MKTRNQIILHFYEINKFDNIYNYFINEIVEIRLFKLMHIISIEKKR